MKSALTVYEQVCDQVGMAIFTTLKCWKYNTVHINSLAQSNA